MQGLEALKEPLVTRFTIERRNSLQGFHRFFDASYSHDQPIYYYVPILIGGLVPWTFALPFIPWRHLAPNPARSR